MNAGIQGAGWRRIRGLALFLGVLVAMCARAQTYTPPPSHRTDTVVDSNWRFILQNVSGAQAANFDDSSWTNLNLPHTWNNLDGQDGGNNYYRGIGWYRAHINVSGSLTNREFFLKFDGAYLVADVYVNGNLVGEHQGGFAAFTFDVTSNLNIGGDNVIAVEVNNAFNPNLPPLNADFTFFGGLYRDVHLLVTDPVQVSPLDYGSPGIYLKTTAVSASSASLQVTTVVSNTYATARPVLVRTVLTDAATNIVIAWSNTVTVPAASASNAVASVTVSNPHLWNGLADPYLYQAFTEIWVSNSVVDVVPQTLGFRSFYVDPTNGFFLNGSHYDLHGVNMHQDWLNCGWALTNAQRDTNFMFIKEMGVTFVRLSHYEHNDYTYQLADQNGVCVWSEIPIIDYITESPGFYTNTLQQLREMIRQRFNHPAVVCWSVYNEITLQAGPPVTNLISQEVQLVPQEDPTRILTAAANTSDSDPSTLFFSTIAFNKYYGWYSSPLNGIGGWADNIHATYPTRCFGISEYGAGASAYQHSENPTFPGNTATSFHPEEWQNIVIETNWQMMAARPFLWCKQVWTSFDFASDGRSEGDTPGRNDKGVVTYDRQVRKDAFYYFKANWTTNPMVYITGHTFTNRLTNVITAKAYANCDSVQLFLNGVSQGTLTSSNFIYNWPVTLLPGSNFVQTIGIKGGSNVTDSLVWYAPISPPVISVVSPVGAIAFLNSINDKLQLSVTVSNPFPANAVTTSWSAVSGPGLVVFENSNALNTTASFSSNGIYTIQITANNGGVTTQPVTVAVGPVGNITNGLVAWWKMNETSGTTAADSSGNGNTATNHSATFTNYTTGYPSNALHFNGTSSYASFPSPPVTQLTLVAWARATGHGNSTYPRIFDTPGYRLFFRFDNQGSNGFDFATYSANNGDWFSGANTINTNIWYHIAATYDLSNLNTVPAEFVNGSQIAAPTVITSASGSQPASTGVGYLGNTSGLSRAWAGDLSDVRIYNRILSGAEIHILANSATANYAPTVNAGSSQNILWPAKASLTGSVSDDGKPNPPGATTVTWSQIGGPGTVAFANPNTPSTTASFSAPGSYQLQLAASDGQAATVGTVTVNAIKPSLAASLSQGTLRLSWPTTTNWSLEYQTNPPYAGLGTNWMMVPGLVTNPFSTSFQSNAGSVFYRLVVTNQ